MLGCNCQHTWSLHSLHKEAVLAEHIFAQHIFPYKYNMVNTNLIYLLYKMFLHVGRSCYLTISVSRKMSILWICSFTSFSCKVAMSTSVQDFIHQRVTLHILQTYLALQLCNHRSPEASDTARTNKFTLRWK